MKRTQIRMILAILAAGLLVVGVYFGWSRAHRPTVSAVTAEELVGPWHLAEEENDHAAIRETFPGAMEFGGAMEIRRDGSISCYIGAYGGDGTYTFSGDVLRAKIKNTLDASSVTAVLTAERQEGQLRLIMELEDLRLYWVRGEGESGQRN